MKIKIGNTWVGEKFPSYIVAECGINHNGNVKIAKQLVEKAKKCGANAVKFQTFKAEDLTSPLSKYYKIFKKLELDYNDFLEIYDYGKSEKISVFSTPFSIEAVNQLDRLQTPAFKIASGDLTYLELIHHAATKKKPIIISTGMANMKEVKDAINEVKKAKNNKIVLLHSVSAYPTPISQVNLKAMITLQKKFSMLTGFSDNGANQLVPIVAVALGAKLIEKHFTINKKMKGPDHKLSADPRELTEIVKNIRDMELMLGDGLKNYQYSEKENRIHARRSITAITDIPKNRIITSEMISIKRPATGIEPKYYQKIIGKTTNRKIRANDSIKWNYLQ